MKVIVGTRGSALAIAQTESVVARIRDYQPKLNVEIKVIKTTGDVRSNASLAEIGGFGAFTREIEQALLDKTIDVAVHSLKDLPIVQPPGLKIVAITERVSPEDVLISRNRYTLDTLPNQAIVGTSSLRRKMQVGIVRPDLIVKDIRGNVPTRLKKLEEGMFDALIMARAGLIRLGLYREAEMYTLPLEVVLPAPGQGAIAVEIRENDNELASYLAPLNNADAAAAVQCERSILRGFGGGCRTPLGAYAYCQMNGDITVQAIAAVLEMDKVLRIERTLPRDAANILGWKIGEELRQRLKQP